MALEGLIEEYATRAYVILRRTDSTLPFIYECGDEESIRQHLMGLGEDCKDEVDEWMDAIYAELKDFHSVLNSNFPTIIRPMQHSLPLLSPASHIPGRQFLRI